MLVKTTEKSLLRDSVSRSLINNDIEAFRAYKTHRETRNLISGIIKDIENLKAEIKALREMTQQLVEKE